MATFKGVMRSYNAAVRRAEREKATRARETAKRFKEQQKMQEIGDASSAVAQWEDYVKLLKTIHASCSEPIDWHSILSAPRPKEPVRKSINASAVQEKIDSFTPSFLDRLLFEKLFSSVDKKLKKLKQELDNARKTDNEEYAEALKDFNQECEEWEAMTKMAEGVLNNNPACQKAAIEHFDPFSEIKSIGNRVELVLDKGHVDIDVHVSSIEVVPDYVLSQTSTGKLSKKKMVKSTFNELYQDHVCSTTLRVAREVFSCLPISIVRISAMAEVLNTTTGFLEEQPILSVIIPRATLEKINMAAIDPSDSMVNFVHAMKFKKADGFQTVEKVGLPLSVSGSLAENPSVERSLGKQGNMI